MKNTFDSGIFKICKMTMTIWNAQQLSTLIQHHDNMETVLCERERDGENWDMWFRYGESETENLRHKELLKREDLEIGKSKWGRGFRDGETETGVIKRGDLEMEN